MDVELVQYVLNDLECDLDPYDAEDIVEAYDDDLSELVAAILRATENRQIPVRSAAPVPEQIQRALRVLGVPPGLFFQSTDKMKLVRSAYLDLARHLHADRNVRASPAERQRRDERMRDVNRARERVELYMSSTV